MYKWKQIEGPTNILTEQQTDRQTITTFLRFANLLFFFRCWESAEENHSNNQNQMTVLVACCHSFCLFYIFCSIHGCQCVQRGPDRIGSLGKPTASSAFLLSRASSFTRFLTFPTRQPQYQAIRVWSYTTFIAYGSRS
jgi:hypothetical protein